MKFFVAAVRKLQRRAGAFIVAISAFFIISATLYANDETAEVLEIVARKVGNRRYTVDDRLMTYGASARNSLSADFKRWEIPYPPKKMILVGLKTEKILELYASDGSRDPKLIKRYPILAASGTVGPKLREGDRQVPEGIYRIESLNPNSLYHLSLRVNYPNEFDRNQARREGRSQLGGDIMIHGKQVSIGCLAIGDQAIEELFVLAADTGLSNITVILSPLDFRYRDLPISPSMPDWVPTLYQNIKQQLLSLKTAP